MEEENKKVAVAGHISLDITPVFQNNRRQRLSELLQLGKLPRIKKAMMCTGGTISNTSPGLKRLGMNVVLIAKIGDGYFGNAPKDMISVYGCETCINQVSGEGMFCAIALASKGLGRFFLHNSGCNDTFDCRGVDFGEVEETSYFHFDYPPITRGSYLDEGEELVRLLKKVRSMGLITPLSLVAVGPDSEAAGMDWARILERVPSYANFFVPSIEELGYMLGRPPYCKWQGKAGGEDVTGILSLEEGTEPLATRMLSVGVRCILLKYGATGMYLKATPEPVWRKFLPEFTEWGDISYFEDSHVLDYTLSGAEAGDISITAFIRVMLDGYEPLECIHLAAAIDAPYVTAYDALGDLLSFEGLRQKVEAG